MQVINVNWRQPIVAIALATLQVPAVWSADAELLGRQAEQAGKLREAFTHYQTALQSASQGGTKDLELRKKIILLAPKIAPAPTIPEAAKQHFVQAVAKVKAAQYPEEFMDAVNEFQQALLLAPWFADGYYNLGLAQDKADRPSEAIESLKLYLLAEPQAADSKQVQNFINYLEIGQVIESREPKKEQAKTQRRRPGLEFVLVSGGCFDMGDIFGDGESDEKPVHQVCVNDFYLGKYEVTQKQWTEVMGNNPSHHKGCDDCPVEKVSWKDAQEFIGLLNQKTGLQYRLPTEAEWEYAARSGGKKEKWAGTNKESELGEYAWFGEYVWYKSNVGAHPVGLKKPNGLGLYDMSGNVWEWTASNYEKKYDGAESCASVSGISGRMVERGGSWDYKSSGVRTTYRYWDAPGRRDNNVGFRLARTP